MGARRRNRQVTDCWHQLERSLELVVQADQLGTGLAQVTVALITSNVARAEHKSRVLVPVSSPEAKPTGLLLDSVVMTDNLATIHTAEIDRIIGNLSGMEEVDEALRATLGL